MSDDYIKQHLIEILLKLKSCSNNRTNPVNCAAIGQQFKYKTNTGEFASHNLIFDKCIYQNQTPSISKNKPNSKCKENENCFL